MKNDSIKSHDEAYMEKKKEQRKKTVIQFLIALVILVIICLAFRSCRAKDEPAPTPTREVCIKNALILAMDLYLAMDGKWTQRNWNIMTFGASGSGKTRYFIEPNVLQMLGCYILVDPSGEIEQKHRGVFEKNGYRIRRHSTDDMTKSNCFNPLYYIRTTSDILVVVNILLENTQEGDRKGGGKGFGGNDG